MKWEIRNGRWAIVAIVVVLCMPSLSLSAQQPSRPVDDRNLEGVDESPAKDGQTPQSAVENQQPAAASEGPQDWEALVAYWMTPRAFPKASVIKIDDTYAYPHVAVSYMMKIVREDEDSIWLVGISPENPASVLHRLWLQRQVDEFDAAYRQDYFSQPGAAYFLDHRAETVPPPFIDSLQFERGAPDLPTTGRWQMGFDVADMNGDGHVDLVLPPQRKATPPMLKIYAGNGAGDFHLWKNVEIPNVGLDYGGVAVADFDLDGHQDIAIAIHFGPQYILFGDGNGAFQRLGRLPSPDPRISSRAVTAADFDGDGRTDLAFLAEVDFERSTSASISGARTVWVALNRGEKWEVDSDGLPTNYIGDVIRTADVNRDGRPDLVLSSSTLNERDLVYVNGGDEPWTPAEERGVLSAAYHFDVEPVGDEVFATFVQFRVVDGENQSLNGLIRYPLTFGDEAFVNGQPIMWEKERADVYFRLAVGDLNGSGLSDLVAARKGGGLEVWLQTDDGQFYLERGSEFENVGRVFDIRLLDLNADGRDEIVASYVPNGGKPGGIGVWFGHKKAAQ